MCEVDDKVRKIRAQVELEMEHAEKQMWVPAAVRFNQQTLGHLLDSAHAIAKCLGYVSYTSPNSKTFYGLAVYVDNALADDVVDVLCLSPQRKTTSIQPDPPKPKAEVDGANPYQREVNRWFKSEATQEDKDFRASVEKQGLDWFEFEREALPCPWALYRIRNGSVWMARRMLANYVEEKERE